MEYAFSTRQLSSATRVDARVCVLLEVVFFNCYRKSRCQLARLPNIGLASFSSNGQEQFLNVPQHEQVREQEDALIEL